ncbi:MAG: deiodinase-related protein, partial [Gaiellaceae bacterium]
STFYAEQLAPVGRDRDAFRRGLERNGPRAVTEFARAEQIWAERARAARRSS